MTGDYSNQHLVPMKKVVEPQGEARSDFDVFADMAELIKPGGRDVYTEGKSEMDWLKGFYEAAQKADDQLVFVCLTSVSSGTRTN